jgi:hypothetical protein
MKPTLAIIILLFHSVAWSACSRDDVAPPDPAAEENFNENDEDMKDTITITIGTKIFKATLESNATASQFKSMLPLTVDMKDLNSNEKFFDFANNLPTNPSNSRTINSGDLMLWGSNTLVLFYKSFSTSYNYTRLGKIENPSGLAEALGLGNVNVKFDLQK